MNENAPDTTIKEIRNPKYFDNYSQVDIQKEKK